MAPRGAGRAGTAGGSRSSEGLPRNVQLEGGGYANVQDVLNTQACKSLKITFEEIQQVVADNEKQRFSLKPIFEAIESNNEFPSAWLLRANQGHSIKVEDEGLLQPITLKSPDSLPDMAIHGTTHSAWHLIVKSGGLKLMTRNHVHFASGLPAGVQMLQWEPNAVADPAHEPNGTLAKSTTAEVPVVSGMRANSPILIYLDLPAALRDGIAFGRSENGVVLTAGNEQGLVPLQYFKLVEERQLGYGILMRDGKMQNNLPEHVRGGGRGAHKPDHR